VEDYRDGYIWYVNNFSFGEYQLMGWQNGAWGNPVPMEKGVLERKGLDGIQIYRQTICPEFGSTNV
jgi:hypothetical protein